MDVTRRAFLRDLGQGSLAVAVLGVGVLACSSDSNPVGADSTTTTRSGPVDSSQPPSTTTTMAGSVEGVSWERVVLGSVSAYVLVRAGEAAVVDTGFPGDAADIAATLVGLGIGWSDVSTIILTHSHGDHVGSLGDVMAAAPDAIGYGGEPDIPGMRSPRPITPVGDGDTVFGLEIIATPGHTPGSIVVRDPVSGLLVAGDALRGDGGGVIGPSPRFTVDMDLANASIRKLSGLEFDAVVFGHGDPVVGNAAQQVAALAATL